MKALPIVVIAVALIAIVTAAFMNRAKRPEPVIHRPPLTAKPPETAPVPPQPPIETQPGVVNDTPTETAPQASQPSRDNEPPIVSNTPHKSLPRPAPREESAKAIRELGVKDILLAYTRAVATGKVYIAKGALAALKRDRELALRIARQELQNAKNDTMRQRFAAAIEAISKEP